MTFDEWLIEYNKQHGLPPAHVVAKAAWNAAVQACVDEVEFHHRLGHAPPLLEGLKTPLEAPETQKVGDTMPSYDWEANKWVVAK